MYRYWLLILSCLTQVGFSQNSTIQPFAENVMSLFPNVRDLAITNTNDEAFFTAQSPLGEISVIVSTVKLNNAWTNLEVAPFSGQYQDLEPFLSNDGLKLYFASNRPKSDTSNIVGDFDIWFVERESKGSAWSKPINVGAPINSEHNEFYPSISNNGNFYFTSDAPSGKGKDDIYVSEWNEQSYSIPISLSDSINTAGYEFNAFIAPDESYLIFSGYNRKDGFGSADLYISFRDENGSWLAAKNLGATINSNKLDYCPFVDAKTNHLYFTSKRNNLDSETKINSIIELLQEINQYENGLSRIYQVSINELIDELQE